MPITLRSLYVFLAIILWCGGFFLNVSVFSAHGQVLTTEERAQLEAQLAEVQAEQAQAQHDLSIAQTKSSSLQNDINVLTAKIRSEQLDIQAKNLLIKTLGDNITTKQGEINTLDAAIARDKEDIGALFREVQQTDNITIPEVLLSSGSLSAFWDDIIKIETVQQSLGVLSLQLAVHEASSTAEKNTLVVKQTAAIDTRYAIQQEQKTVQANQAQQKQLLAISKNNEHSYTALVEQKKKQADAIKARLFALAGGSNPIPFGQAYSYARSAQKGTGVDPAFLLAIMTQESNLGTNQGTCYLTDTKTGAGVSVKSGRAFDNVMSPTRDVPPFLTIAAALDVDPLHTVVSCPQSVGWGGAMGPAQFIASTWMLLKDRVASALGFSGMANPWDPRDAFMASAMYLSDLGASSGGYTASRNAACRYYSGNVCSKSSLIASYGDSVMSLASTIQTTEIDKITGI
ncbi:MAG: lytic murein transglycosylase [Patescibacteria group bacterium]|nr:lytic murein transglycosylase [Patescibacteria group bacterium]MDE2437937.1 lytic murein transglycosylase [Patescibacteria group bacterium]